ncbi:hypothetical protein QQ045_028636 [Rhodiola kirilowii]
MAGTQENPTVMQKVGQLQLISRLSLEEQTRFETYQRPAAFQRQFAYGNYSNGGLQYAATVSKIAATPIERVKLLIQNQDEMLKAGRLSKPYKGTIGECFSRTIKEEVLGPSGEETLQMLLDTSPLNLFNFKKDRDGYLPWFAGNLASGGASSLLFVYSLDYARTRLANDA